MMCVGTDTNVRNSEQRITTGDLKKRVVNDISGQLLGSQITNTTSLRRGRNTTRRAINCHPCIPLWTINERLGFSVMR
jgi:hypothetical protein